MTNPVVNLCLPIVPPRRPGTHIVFLMFRGKVEAEKYFGLTDTHTPFKWTFPDGREVLLKDVGSLHMLGLDGQMHWYAVGHLIS